jgi:pimeloyl-ACP methyl ester carboxylesterase
LIVLATALAGGCMSPRQPVSDRPERGGYLLVFPGVGNMAISVAGMVSAMREAHVAREIEIDYWGLRFMASIKNLQSYEANRRRARADAERLAARIREHPEDPVTLLGYSGGAGMVVFTAEALPDDVKIDRIVLLGAALSPGYDLGPALAHTRRGMVSFYSPRDKAILGWGTRTFGTMDRRYTDSAGEIGFQHGDGSLVGGAVTQIAWRPAWRWLGHFGNHAGWASRAWAERVLVPCLLGEPSPGQAAVPRAGQTGAVLAKTSENP